MMKRFFLTAMAATALAMTSCFGNSGQTADQTAADSTSTKPKTLVAYFSATGHTEKVAKQIADATGADLVEITPKEPYTEADLNWRDSLSRSSVEMADSTSRPEITNKRIKADEYDLIFIGFPIWWDLAPSVVNTFIESNNFAGKTVVPFATSGGSTIDNSAKHLRHKYPTINWKEGRLLNGATAGAVDDWLRYIR